MNTQTCGQTLDVQRLGVAIVSQIIWLFFRWHLADDISSSQSLIAVVVIVSNCLGESLLNRGIQRYKYISSSECVCVCKSMSVCVCGN